VTTASWELTREGGVQPPDLGGQARPTATASVVRRLPASHGTKSCSRRVDHRVVAARCGVSARVGGNEAVINC
jgi:hypothetical protein